MLHLISGGAGSGKSAYAEAQVLASPAQRRIYLATMVLWDEECRRRAARHRAMRRDKGFVTLECPTGLAGAEVPPDSVVLLEDLSNVVANECYGGCGFDRVEEAVLRGMERLCAQAADVVVVTNELFSDGVVYDPSTQRYLSCLAALNRCLARRADRVTEVVAGIPVRWKGGAP